MAAAVGSVQTLMAQASLPMALRLLAGLLVLVLALLAGVLALPGLLPETVRSAYRGTSEPGAV